MASKTISTILNLKDNFSSTLKKTTENTKEFKRKTREAQSTLKDFKNTAVTGFKALGIAAAAGTAAMGAIFKQSLDFADGIQKTADITGFTAERVQELTYVGENLGVSFDTISGANAKLIKTMAQAKDGFKTSAESMLVQKKAALEVEKANAAYNNTVKKYGKDSLEARTAQIALTEAQDKQKESLMSNTDVFSKLKVSITDSSGKLRDSKVVFSEVIDKLGKMDNATERDAMAMKIFGKSAMELNPLIKAGGAEIAKMTDELKASGAILSGEQVAALDTFGDSMGSLGLQFKGIGAQLAVEFLPALQGMIDKFRSTDFKPIIAEAKTLISEGFEKLGFAIKWVTDNFNWLAPIMAAVVSGIVAFNVISGAIALFNALKIVTIASTFAQSGLNAAFLACPLTWIVAAIAAIIAIFVALVMNWDKVKAAAIALWATLTTTFASVKESISGHMTALWGNIQATISNIKGGFIAAFSAIGSFVSDIFKGIANSYISAFNFIISGINKLQFKTPDWIPGIGGKQIGANIPLIPKFANGTQYFKGGLANINERGKGEIVNLPNGSQVIPADKSAKMMGSQSIQVFVNIAGNIIGNEEYARYIGGVIAKDIQFALVK